MKQVHFLHIGKCAGTYVKAIAQKINAAPLGVQIVTHPHHVILASLPPGAPYFFSIRRPETRFVSGFYSRKRKGQPRYNSEWTPQERLAFTAFEQANDLAEALFADGEKGRTAFAAMKSIEHLAMAQSDYVRGVGFFLDVRPPLAIVRQEHFEADMALLCRRLGIGAPPSVPTDAVTAHRNDYAGSAPLSEAARANLRLWYAQDEAFYRICSDWIDAGRSR